MIQKVNWRRFVPKWLGGEEPPKAIPQTFIEFLRANQSTLGLVLNSTNGDTTTYYRTGVSSDFTFTVAPAAEDQRNTVLTIELLTAEKRQIASRQLKQAYNRYLADKFPAEERTWPKVVLME